MYYPHGIWYSRIILTRTSVCFCSSTDGMDRSSNPSANAAGVLTKELPRIAAAEDIKISRREDFKMEVSRLDTVDDRVKP